MEATSSALGLIVIVVLYIAIGGMSAAGSVYLSKLIFTAKQEQIFFGLFLIPIAGFYLAFAAHFGSKDAWALESKRSGSVCCSWPRGHPSSACSHCRIPAAWDLPKPLLRQWKRPAAGCPDTWGNTAPAIVPMAVFGASLYGGLAVSFVSRSSGLSPSETGYVCKQVVSVLRLTFAKKIVIGTSADAQGYRIACAKERRLGTGYGGRRGP